MTTTKNAANGGTHTPGQQEGGAERPSLELLQGGASGGANPLFITTEDVGRTEPREDWLIAIAQGHLAKHNASRVTPQLLLASDQFKKFCVRKWTDEVTEFQRIEAKKAEAARTAALTEAQRTQEREERETQAELDSLLRLVPLSPEETATQLEQIRLEMTGGTQIKADPKLTETEEREARKRVNALRPKLGTIVPSLAWEDRFAALAARKVFIFEGAQVFSQELEKQRLPEIYRKNLEMHAKQIDEVIGGLTELLVATGIPKEEIGKGDNRCDYGTYQRVKAHIKRDSKWGKLLSQPSSTLLETEPTKTDKVEVDPATAAKTQEKREVFLSLITKVVTDRGQAQSLANKAAKAQQEGEEPTATFKRLAANRQHDAVRTNQVKDGEINSTAKIWMTLARITEPELLTEVEARVVALRAAAEHDRARADKPCSQRPVAPKVSKKGKSGKNADKKK